MLCYKGSCHLWQSRGPWHFHKLRGPWWWWMQTSTTFWWVHRLLGLICCWNLQMNWRKREFYFQPIFKTSIKPDLNYDNNFRPTIECLYQNSILPCVIKQIHFHRTKLNFHFNLKELLFFAFTRILVYVTIVKTSSQGTGTSSSPSLLPFYWDYKYIVD